MAAPGDESFVAIDEGLWATFYDVPSRRFRAIRDDFVQRKFDAVSADLVTSASYLQIESGRTAPELAERMAAVAAQMTTYASDISNPDVTTDSLDRLFSRAHWLLAQHYLFHSRQARDANNNKLAGRYLWAMTHHLERAVLWSNLRIDRRFAGTLDDLRELALRLQDPNDAAAARKEKPVVRAAKLLVDVGSEIDRRVALKID